MKPLTSWTAPGSCSYARQSVGNSGHPPSGDGSYNESAICDKSDSTWRCPAMVITALLAASCLGLLPSRAYGQQRPQYNMDEIRDASLLELKVLKLVKTLAPSKV